MRFKYFKNLLSIKKYWDVIDCKNDKVYQTYEFSKLVYNYRKTSVQNIKNRNRRTLFIVGFDNDKPCCIAPLAVDEREKSVYLLGYGTNAGYLDFIYSEGMNNEKINELLKECCKALPNYKFKFTDLMNSSKLFQITKKYKDTEKECYAITLPDSYEAYYKNLSKSTRQNIRTVYNRMEKDSVDYKFEIYDNHIDGELVKKINCIYSKRREEWYGISSTGDNHLKRRLQYWKNMNRDIIFQSVKKIHNTVVAIVEINNQPAAFMIGYKYDNRLIVPRLAIDTEYSKYSPGGLLLIEYIKKLYHNESSNGFVIDLSRGNENYKKVYGGELSFTYTTKFDSNEYIKS